MQAVPVRRECHAGGVRAEKKSPQDNDLDQARFFCVSASGSR